MKRSIITHLLKAIMSMLSPEVLKGAITAMLDWLETQIKASPNVYDDLLLPVIENLRKALDKPEEG